MPFLKSLVDTCIYRSDPPSSSSSPPSPYLSPLGRGEEVRGVERGEGGYSFTAAGRFPPLPPSASSSPSRAPRFPGSRLRTRKKIAAASSRSPCSRQMIPKLTV